MLQTKDIMSMFGFNVGEFRVKYLEFRRKLFFFFGGGGFSMLMGERKASTIRKMFHCLSDSVN